MRAVPRAPAGVGRLWTSTQLVAQQRQRRLSLCCLGGSTLPSTWRLAQAGEQQQEQLGGSSRRHTEELEATALQSRSSGRWFRRQQETPCLR